MPIPSAKFPNSDGRFYAYLSSWKANRARANMEVFEQRQVVFDWADVHSIDIADSFTEYGSQPVDYFSERAEGMKLLAAASRGDTIVAAKFDRLFGAPEDAHATLVLARGRGINIRALDIGGGKQALQLSRDLDAVLLAVSAVYSDYPKRFAARRVKKQQASVRRYRGANPPFGYDVGPDGQLLVDLAKQQHIAVLSRMRNDGASLRALERFSKEAGFPISHAGIRKVLERTASRSSDKY